MLQFSTPVIWKEPSTWLEPLTVWLERRLNGDAMSHLLGIGEQDICWDDTDWLDHILTPHLNVSADEVVSLLAEALLAATLRVYHGCRVPDAGIYHRFGLRINDPSALQNEARRIVAEEESLAWMRPRIDQMIADFESTDRDTGKLYVCLDDRPQLDYMGHYALYGSEWLSCLLGSPAFPILRSRGTPTILEIDLPLRMVAGYARADLASALLQEWTRQIVNRPDWTPEVDFTFMLRENIAPEAVVAHYHPTHLKCPYEKQRVFQSKTTVCPSCQGLANAMQQAS